MPSCMSASFLLTAQRLPPKKIQLSTHGRSAPLPLPPVPGKMRITLLSWKFTVGKATAATLLHIRPHSVLGAFSMLLSKLRSSLPGGHLCSSFHRWGNPASERMMAPPRGSTAQPAASALPSTLLQPCKLANPGRGPGMDSHAHITRLPCLRDGE